MSSSRRLLLLYIACSGQVFLKLFGLPSGHSIVSAAKTFGDYFLMSTMLAILHVEHWRLTVLQAAMHVWENVLILVCGDDVLIKQMPVSLMRM